MLRTGQRVRTDGGRQLRVDAELPPGAQAFPYRVTDLDAGRSGVLKILTDRSADARRRVGFLTGARVDRMCPVLCAPTDPVTSGALLGHYCALAPGLPMEQSLATPGGFVEHLALALALAHAVECVHRQGIAHGDLHAGNVFMQRHDRSAEIHLIDFDNFTAPGAPGPPCVGHALYMAPELRAALAAKRRALPDVRSDRYALAVLLHELVLLRHVAAGADATDEAFARAMCAGRWIHDPAGPDRPREPTGGYPTETLDPDIARLFRRAFSLAPDERPAAAEWAEVLRRALFRVAACAACGAPCLADASKTSCPTCRAPFPTLTLVLPGGPVPLTDGSLVIGRDHLGGAHISARHAIFRRAGPNTFVESLGQNHTFRWAAGRWVQLPDQVAVLIEQGDRLRLADVEVAIA